MKRTFPQVFESSRDSSGRRLSRAGCCDMLESLAPDRRRRSPRVVVLTPGHLQLGLLRALASWPSRWASSWSKAATSSCRTASSGCGRRKGFERVDVIYRRIDDDFLDPQAFRADSLLGVPGLMDVYRAGRVALANAPGHRRRRRQGRLRLRAEIIKYYLGEDAILPNVPTYRLLATRRIASYVLANLDELVVKAGQRIGRLRHADRAALDAAEQRAEFAAPDRGQPAQLHRAADAGALARADDRRRHVRRPARRPAAVHPLRQGHLRAARRPDARRAEEGFAGRELVAGRRQQGHLGARRRSERTTAATQSQPQSPGAIVGAQS